MSDRKKLGKAVRLKGHNWERAVAQALRTLYPDKEIVRGQQARQKALHGTTVPDVEAIPEGLQWWVECGHTEVCKTLQSKVQYIKKKYHQARRDQEMAEDERDVMLAIKFSRDLTLVGFSYIVDFGRYTMGMRVSMDSEQYGDFVELVPFYEWLTIMGGWEDAGEREGPS